MADSEIEWTEKVWNPVRDGAPWYGLNGCLKWGDGGRGAMCRKLLRAIEAHGWAVQSIDGDGVLVARIGGHDVR